MLSSLWKFLNYWHFRYLLVTELYMVEKWEQVMIYIACLIFFMIVSLFNNFVIVGLISLVLNHKEELLLFDPISAVSSLLTLRT